MLAITELTKELPTGRNSSLGIEPEQGGFDFFTYLMGLNGPTLPAETGVELSVTDAKGETGALEVEEKVRKNFDELNLASATPLEGAPIKPDLKLPGLKVSRELGEEVVRELKGQKLKGASERPSLKSETTFVKTDPGAEFFRRQMVTEAPQGGISQAGMRQGLVESHPQQFHISKQNEVGPLKHDRAVNRYRALDSPGDKMDQLIKPVGAEHLKVESKSVENVSGITSAPIEREIVLEKKNLDPKERVSSDPINTDLTQFNLDRVHVTPIKMPAKTHPMEKLSVPEVFERIEHLAHRGGGEMRVSLTPPELGRVDIHVALNGNQVEVQMHSENTGAKAAIENSLNDLRQSLSSLDLNLTRVEVFAGKDTGFNFQDGSQARFSQPQFDGGEFFGESKRRNFEPTAQVASIKRSRSLGWSNGVDLKI